MCILCNCSCTSGSTSGKIIYEILIVLFLLGSPCEPNPCNNGGQCIETPMGDYTCQCALGFTGM